MCPFWDYIFRQKAGLNFQVLDLQTHRYVRCVNLYIERRSGTNDLVVVKYLEELHFPHFRKACEREVRLLTRKRCSMIRILGWNLNTDCAFYVMPYLQSSSVIQYARQLTCTLTTA